MLVQAGNQKTKTKTPELRRQTLKRYWPGGTGYLQNWHTFTSQRPNYAGEGVATGAHWSKFGENAPWSDPSGKIYGPNRVTGIEVPLSPKHFLLHVPPDPAQSI